MLNHMYLFCIDLAKVNPDAGTEELIGYSGAASSLGCSALQHYGSCNGVEGCIASRISGGGYYIDLVNPSLDGILWRVYYVSFQIKLYFNKKASHICY